MNDTKRGVSAGYVVALLCVIYVIAFVDRFILSVLAPGVSASLNLSDRQIAFLISLSFAILYTVFAIPVAHWMDQRDRRWGLVTGVTLWSASTAASAFAQNFEVLLICRAGVAIGETVLTPAAVSMIADLYPPNRRAGPMSAFAATGATMGVGGLAVGAAVLQLSEQLSPAIGAEPWRITLFLLGVVGLVMGGIIAACVAEPPRVSHNAGDNASSFGELFRFASANRRFFIPFYLGSGIGTLFPFALLTWSPTLLVRGFGAANTAAAYQIGIAGLITATLGTAGWAALARWFDRTQPGRGLLLSMSVAASLVAISVFAPLLDSGVAVVAGIACTMAGFAAWTVLPALIVQRFGPARMRARLSAFHLLCASLLGFAIGPGIAVELSHFWEGPRALGYGIAALGLVSAPIAVLCYLRCYRATTALLAYQWASEAQAPAGTANLVGQPKGL